MNVVLLALREFSGWDSFVGRCRALGQRRLAVRLAEYIANYMAEYEGVFSGDSYLNYNSATVISRVTLRLWIDEGAGHPDLDVPLSAAEIEQLKELLAEANELSQQAIHRGNEPAENAGSRAKRRNICEGLWGMALQTRQRNASAKFEIARAWLYMYEYWPSIREKLETETRTALHTRNPLDSAFDAVEYVLLLSVLLLVRGPYQQNPTALFHDTRFSGIAASLLEWYAPLASDVVGSWTDIRAYPRVGIESPFLESPVLRAPDGALFAPDPSLLTNAIEERVLRKALESFAADGDGPLERARTIVGHVVETHVGRLATAIADAGAERHVNEFRLADGTQSADAFLMGQRSFFMEAKATKFPRPYEKNWKLRSCFEWLWAVAGGRASTGRQPFEQGLAFLNKWRQGDVECVTHLGPFPTEDQLEYLLVSSEEIPLPAHWDEFREVYWAPEQRFGAEQRKLMAKTSFISVRDLEAVAGLLTARSAAGTPLTFAEVISGWKEYWRGGPLPPGAGMRDPRLKGSLRDYMISQYHEVERAMSLAAEIRSGTAISAA